MPAKLPTARLTSWPIVFLQSAFLLVLTVCLALVFRPLHPLLILVGVLLAHSAVTWLLRRVLIADFQRAVALLRAHRFLEAARKFKAAHGELQRRKWIDDYRWVVLGFATTATCREMALCNAAFCYAQSGNGNQAIV